MSSTAKLVAQHLSTALSATFREGVMPSTPNAVGAVIDLPGDEPVPLICAGPSQYERCRFAVDYRELEVNYEAAVSKLRQAIAALDGRDGQAIGGVLFHELRLTSPPYPVSRDEQNRVRVRTQFRAVRAAEAA